MLIMAVPTIIPITQMLNFVALNIVEVLTWNYY
jgi:hypothetical protein